MQYEGFSKTLNTFETFMKSKEKSFNNTSEIIAFIYYYLAKLNQFFLNGQFNSGIATVEKAIELVDRYEDRLDPHRVMVFYYKFAWMYFGAGQYSKALDFLNKIIYLDIKRLRGDIQAYARILSLMIHYELGNYQLLEYQIKSVTRFLEKVEERSITQKGLLNLLNRISYRSKEAQIAEMKTLKHKLSELSSEEYDQKSFIYLDIISWLESKIKDVPLAKVIQERFTALLALDIDDVL